MPINFDNVEFVERANSRINYDLRFSAKTGRFTLSEGAYNKYDINNNGFLLGRDGDTPLLVVVPNEEAVVHPGRSDANKKGKTFTANSLASMLGVEEGEESAEFVFNEQTHEGQTYLTMERIDEPESEEQSITASEDMPHEEVPSDDVEMGEGSMASADSETPSWN